MEQKPYTISEEIIHIISHSIGIIFFTMGLILLLIHSHSTLGTICSIIYSLIMIYYYIISCITHSINLKKHINNSLSKLNIANQLFFMAGTYTPITLCKLNQNINWIIFLVIWSLTILLTVISYNNYEKHKIIYTGINLLIFWTISTYIIKTIPKLPFTAIELVIIGNIHYTIGILYQIIKPNDRYRHSLFHIYTLICSILYLITIYKYII